MSPCGRWSQRCMRICCFAVTLGALSGRRSGLAEGLRVSWQPESLESMFALLVRDVGLEPGAVVSINVSNAKPSKNTVLVILSQDQWERWLDYLPALMQGDDKISYLISHARYPLGRELSTRHVICAAASDRYFIGVLNARFEKMMLEGSVSYENPNGQNLPLQLVHMPTTLALASMAFVLLVQIAALLLSTVWFQEATMLHALLVVCIALKALETAFKGSIFMVLARQGESEVWRFQ
ncbi:unnamed protein product, partial [Polarella glacialis]